MQPPRSVPFMILFSLRNGHNLQICTGEATARKAVTDWLHNGFGKQRISNLDYPPGDQPWAVNVEDIVCVQTFNLAAQPKVQQQQPAAYQSPFGHNQSGM